MDIAEKTSVIKNWSIQFEVRDRGDGSWIAERVTIANTITDHGFKSRKEAINLIYDGVYSLVCKAVIEIENNAN